MDEDGHELFNRNVPNDLLPEAWIAPLPVKDLRMILRHRAALVRQRTVFKTRVRAVLADRGVDAPEALWAGPGRKRLAKLDLPGVERELVDDLCGLVDAMEIPVARLEVQLRQLAKPDPRVECLAAPSRRRPVDGHDLGGRDR